MRAKNVSVSLVNSGKGFRVWNASFDFEAPSIPRDKDGKINEAVRKHAEKVITQALASLNFNFGVSAEPQPEVTEEERELAEKLVPELNAYLSTRDQATPENGT